MRHSFTSAFAILVLSASFSTAQDASKTAPVVPKVVSQSANQWLASKFRGIDVLGPDNMKVGDVQDILFDKKTGHVDAYIISVGGFLGMGSRIVALPRNSFDIVPGDASRNQPDKLKQALTKDELKTEPPFDLRAPTTPPAAAEKKQ